MVIHKAMWPVAAAMLLTYIWMSSHRQWLSLLAVAGCPLVVLWVSGWQFHGSPWWLVASNWNAEVQCASNPLLILGGITSTFSGDGLKGFLKGIVVLGIAAVAILVWTRCIRMQTTDAGLGAAVAASILLLAVILNEHELWATVRFSKLLVLPTLLAISTFKPITRARSLGWAAVVLGVASQFVYAWYIAQVFLI